MSERSKTAELSKKAMTDMLQKLQDKDADIQVQIIPMYIEYVNVPAGVICCSCSLRLL